MHIFLYWWLASTTPLFAQNDLLSGQFWELNEAPIAIAIAYGSTRPQIPQLNGHLLDVDSLSIMDPRVFAGSLIESNVILFLTDSWEDLIRQQGVEILVPSDGSIMESVIENGFSTYRFEDSGMRRQSGVLIIVVDDNTSALCLARVIYASILAGFNYPAVQYDSCS